MPDNITDIYINGELDFTLGSDNDLKTTEYEDTVLQSVFIHVKNAIQPYIGSNATRETINSLSIDISSEIRQIDPQIQSVRNVSVDFSDGTITARVGFTFNDQFETVEVTEET